MQSIDQTVLELKRELQAMKVLQETDHCSIRELKRQNDFANSKIAALQDRIIMLSLDAKDTSIKINGVSESNDIPLTRAVYEICSLLLPLLHQTDIYLIYRIGNTPNPAQPRSTFVSFTRSADRCAIFENRDKLRENESTKFVLVNEDIPAELRGPRADMRAVAKLANENGVSAKAVGD